MFSKILLLPRCYVLLEEGLVSREKSLCAKMNSKVMGTIA